MSDSINRGVIADGSKIWEVKDLENGNGNMQ